MSVSRSSDFLLLFIIMLHPDGGSDIDLIISDIDKVNRDVVFR